MDQRTDHDTASAADALALEAARALDGDALWELLMELSKIGGLPSGGVNRQALSEADTAAKNAVIAWAKARGMAAHQDEAANLFIRLEGTEPTADPVLIGSHLDSQPTGGKFDGALGVAAALSGLDAVRRLGMAPRRPVEAVSFMNEEGSRFLPGLAGSSVFTGARPLSEVAAAQTVDGVAVADALERTLAETDAAHRPASAMRPAAFLELHIEQGPVLERGNFSVGIVSGIQGIRSFVVEVTGETAHAGTTPHAMRRDALVGALAIINTLRPLTESTEDVLRLTVGRMEVFPNSPNTVPELVRFTIDLRHPELAELDRVTAFVKEAMAKAAPCRATVSQKAGALPVRFPDVMTATLTEAAEALGLPHTTMLSGAGHDAMLLAHVCPTGMVFIPCRNGLSHHVDEWAEPEHVTAGARVLCAAAARLAFAQGGRGL